MSLAEALLDLQELTRQLRRDCPWDREQTARTIVPHTVEEAYEVADAAVADDDAGLRGELGDLLFQVYFLVAAARGARRRATSSPSRAGCTRSSFAGIRTSSGTPTRARAGRVRERWEEIKSEQEGREGIFHDVPEALPALLEARKVQRRAAAVGFDWPDLAGPLAKVREELEELEAAVERGGRRAPETEPDAAVVRRGRRRALHRRQRRASPERRSRSSRCARRRVASGAGRARRASSPASRATTGRASTSSARTRTTSARRRSSR